MLSKRVTIIKTELKKNNIRQLDIADDLKIHKNSVNYWIYGKFTSEKISEWFRKKFGEGFIKRIEFLN